MAVKTYNLEDRFVEYSGRMIDVVEALPNTRTGNYIAGQLIKSCIFQLLITVKCRVQSRKMRDYS